MKEYICKDELIEYIELGITSTGNSDQYSTGFCNGLIWLKSVIEKEEPHYLDVSPTGTKFNTVDELLAEMEEE